MSFSQLAIAFFLVLSPLIFVHELGHFIAAKRGGIRVIYFWDEPSETFYMLYAYRKSAQEDLTAPQLRTLARLVREEFG